MSVLRHDLARGVGLPAIGWTGAYRVAKRSHRIEILAGVAVALGYLAATAASIDQVAEAFAAAAAALALLSPVSGLATLALILPMREPDVLQPLYVDAVLLGATALGCVLRLPNDGRPLRVHPGVVVAIGYVIYSMLSVVPAISGHPAEWAPTAALQVSRMATGVGTFIVAGYLFRWISPTPVIAIALFGSFLAALLALLAYWKIGPVAQVEGLLSPFRGEERASGGFSNANYLGFFATQATLLALGCWSVAKTRYRPFLAAILAALVAALVLSFSRSAYLGTTAGIVVLAILRSPRAAIVLVVVAVVASAVFYPTFLDARLGGGDVLDPSVIAARSQSENWRRIAAAAGISMFLAEPTFGVGFGVFHHLSPAYIGASPATYSHNAYVQILAEQGLVGSLMVAGIVAALVIALVRSTNPWRVAALPMLGAYLIQSFFINSTTSFQISGLLCVTMAAALSAGDRRQATRPQGALP